MYIFGHAGLTLGAARAVDRGVDLRLALLLALAPDLVDKPAARLIPGLMAYNSRGFGHTLLATALVLAAALLWKRRTKPALVLWGCCAGHLLLDAMWVHPNPAILLWPLLGPLPKPTWPDDLWLTVWYVGGELAGIAILWTLARRHGLFERSRLTALLRTGVLP